MRSFICYFCCDMPDTCMARCLCQALNFLAEMNDMAKQIKFDQLHLIKRTPLSENSRAFFVFGLKIEYGISTSKSNWLGSNPSPEAKKKPGNGLFCFLV